VFVAFVLFAIFVSLFIFIKTSGSKSNTFLLVGLCNSGKTVMFQQLREGLFIDTVTSMKENEGLCVVQAPETRHSNLVHLVDIPGSERIRPKLFDFLPITRGIIFVVDSTELDRGISEFLFSLLTNKIINRNKIPFLIACNKKDIITAHHQTSIRNQLQKEIEKLRQTRKLIPVQNQDEAEDIPLGMDGESFVFDHLDNEVTFCECSAKQGSLEQVVQFLDKY